MNTRYIAVVFLVSTLCLTGTATDIGVAVQRGQKSVDPAILPLVSIVIATEDTPALLDTIVFEDLETHEKYRAVLSKKSDPSHPDMLTAVLAGHQFLSMPIIHLKPGRYQITSLDFLGPTGKNGFASFSFDPGRQQQYCFVVKPGYVNFAGTFLIDAPWPWLGRNNSRRTETSFTGRIRIESSAARDAGWVADVVPGMAALPTAVSKISNLAATLEADIGTPGWASVAKNYPTRPKKRKEVTPKIPAGVPEGTYHMTFDYQIGIKGDIQDAVIFVSSGSSKLDRVHLNALKKQKYLPATEQGKAIAVKATVPILVTVGAEDLTQAKAAASELPNNTVSVISVKCDPLPNSDLCSCKVRIGYTLASRTHGIIGLGFNVDEGGEEESHTEFAKAKVDQGTGEVELIANVKMPKSWVPTVDATLIEDPHPKTSPFLAYEIREIETTK